MSVSQFFTNAKFADLSTLDASGANAVQFNPGERAKVKRVILVTTVAQTTADATITVVVRDRDNGNSTTIGTFTLPFTGSATDDVQYAEFGNPSATADTGVDGSSVYSSVSPGGLIEVDPGQEMVFTSDGGGDAGTYHVYVEYIPEGFNPEVLGITANERTFTAA
jgi:hypothetical protein